MSVGMRDRAEKPQDVASLRTADDDWIEEDPDKDELMDLTEIKGKRVAVHVQQEIRDTLQRVFDDWGMAAAMRLKRMLIKYYLCLSEHKFDFGTFNGLEYEIPLNEEWDGKAIRRNSYNGQSPGDLEWAAAWCDELVERGGFGALSRPLGCAGFVVTNNDGSKRLVIDYGPINKFTVPLSYPCPDINNVILGFQGMNCFSQFDITKAFYNIKVAEKDKEKTAFIMPFGAFTWKVMSLGGVRPPATWAIAADMAFRGVPGLKKYVDDIAVATKGPEAQLGFAGGVLRTPRQEQLEDQAREMQILGQGDQIRRASHQRARHPHGPTNTSIKCCS